MFNRLRLKFLAAAIALLGCSSTFAEVRLSGPHYNSTVVRHEPFSANQRSAIVADILSRLNGLVIEERSGNKNRRIETHSEGLMKEPLALLGALRLTLHSASPGAEMDLMIRIKGKYPTPVQVIWNHRTLVLEIGEETIFAPQKEGVIGLKFVNGSGRWSAVEKAHVRHAIKRLGPAVITLLRDIPLRREKTKRVARVSKGGLYEQKGCFAQIKMYSTAFAGRHLRFAGTPSAPLSKTTSTILHEVAHAIHHTPSRVAYCELERRQKHFESKRIQFNRAVRKQDVTGSASTLRKQQSWFEEERAALEALLQKANRLSAQGPILEAFSKQLGNRLGPTHYGASSVAESFAESFALYFSDRPALTRIWSDMTQWFDQQHYLPKN